MFRFANACRQVCSFQTLRAQQQQGVQPIFMFLHEQDPRILSPDAMHLITAFRNANHWMRPGIQTFEDCGETTIADRADDCDIETPNSRAIEEFGAHHSKCRDHTFGLPAPYQITRERGIVSNDQYNVRVVHSSSITWIFFRLLQSMPAGAWWLRPGLLPHRCFALPWHDQPAAGFLRQPDGRSPARQKYRLVLAFSGVPDRHRGWCAQRLLAAERWQSHHCLW